MKKIILIPSILALIISSNVFSEEIPPTFVANDAITSVHNRCIVRLYDDTDSARVIGLAKAISSETGASLQHIYTHSIKGFAINMPCSAAQQAFGYDPNVTSLEPDSVVSINKGKPSGGGGPSTSTPDPQQVSWGTERVGGAKNGSGKTAWIIDTGIDLDHPDLNVDSSRGGSVISKRGRADMNDENGHGTHVAGIIAAIDNDQGSLGVAQGASVVPVRVLDRNGSGTVSGVIAGVDFVGGNASAGDCVNMSLGGGISNSLDSAVVAAAGTTEAFFVLAAGNEGDDANNHSPARVNGDTVWTISATDVNDNMPSWSNYGTPVDYAAPGVSIFSLWKNGGTNTISGTSMAAPHACAVLMLTGGGPTTDGDSKPSPSNTNQTSAPIIHQ